jgi:bifunctional pyridoxal-dependent enzyme with beta-cystathionase and maltose regulon repressor activities
VPQILDSGSTPVPVALRAPSFDLNVDDIAAVLNPRTVMVIINTPHNPTGVVYSAAALQELSDLLAAVERRHKHPIFLLADEVYRDIVVPPSVHVSPAAFHPNTLIAYSFAVPTTYNTLPAAVTDSALFFAAFCRSACAIRAESASDSGSADRLYCSVAADGRVAASPHH